MRFELVIFDCDGVLVDSEPIANRVLCEQLAAIGLSLAPDEVMRRFVGRTRAGCLELATELLGRALPAGFAGAWDAALFRAFAAELQAIDGVTDVIRELGVPTCVASNSSRERMRVSLQASGLLPFFAGRMFSAVDVERPKPAPDLFLHAAARLGTTPQRCAVIEDTPTGVKAAVAAGMPVFGYAAGAHSSADALAAAGATVFREMRALPALLRASSGRASPLLPPSGARR
jgi:HAD superfamily hydrolase (TIGR01509 family)